MPLDLGALQKACKGDLVQGGGHLKAVDVDRVFEVAGPLHASEPDPFELCRLSEPRDSSPGVAVHVGESRVGGEKPACLFEDGETALGGVVRVRLDRVEVLRPSRDEELYGQWLSLRV